MGRTLLCLHDDAPTVAVVRDQLGAEGFAVLTARSALSAMAVTGPDRIDLVLLGLTAVDERDLEVVPLLRRRWPEARILVLFPLSLRERAARCLELGADGYLPEPFYPGELLALARQVGGAEPPQPRPRGAPSERPAPTEPPPATPWSAAEPAAPEERDPVERLAEGVAHSVRNPLQILELMLGDAEAEGGLDVEGMRDQVRRIAAVVEGLTRFSGRRRLSLRPIDLNALASSVFGPSQRITGGPEIVLSPAPGHLDVDAAPELLRSALEALRARAERVTPLGARIEVRTARRGAAGGGVAELVVTDGGPRLPETERRRVFAPYPDSEAVQEGTGLELAAVAGIVRSHGGTVDAAPAESRPAGTSIVVQLPLLAVRTHGASGVGR